MTRVNSCKKKSNKNKNYVLLKAKFLLRNFISTPS